MSFPLFDKTYLDNRYSATFKNPPVQQPAVLVSALGCTVQLFLEEKEARAFVLTDTILTRPATVTTFSLFFLSHFLTCNCCFVLQPQMKKWGEVRSKLRLPLQSPLACSNHQILNQVHLQNCPEPRFPWTKALILSTCQTIKVARLCCKPEWALSRLATYHPRQVACPVWLLCCPQEGTHKDPSTGRWQKVNLFKNSLAWFLTFVALTIPVLLQIFAMVELTGNEGRSQRSIDW